MKTIWCFCGILAAILALAESVPCSQPKNCPQNELYIPCGEPCQRECRSLNKACYNRNYRCYEGCYCREGFAREPRYGRCIPIQSCPQFG